MPQFLRSSVLCLSILAGIFWPHSAAAQSCPAQKTCFYVPPLIGSGGPDNSGYYGDLVLVSPKADANVTFAFGQQAASTVTVHVGTPVLVTVPSATGEDPNFNEVGHFGTFVQSDRPTCWWSSATCRPSCSRPPPFGRASAALGAASA